MAKKFQLIRDFVQYDLVIDPIDRELKNRGWTVITAKASEYNTDREVRGSLGCQTGSWIYKNPPIKPSFLIYHGVSFIKNWATAYPTWDYIIVPSKFFEENVKGNVLGLGWSKADYFVNNKDNHQEVRKLIKKRHNIQNNNPIILFAPTYVGKGAQPPGTAAKLHEIVAQLPHCNVIFMPHEMCIYKNKFNDYKFKVNSNFGRKYEYLVGCDLLISDISSIVFEFALLDKPIVLLNNPQFPGYLKVAKDWSTEYLDIGDVVSINELQTLRQVVDYNLSNVGNCSDRRDYWVDKALGYCRDGQSTKRIVDKIEEICG